MTAAETAARPVLGGGSCRRGATAVRASVAAPRRGAPHRGARPHGRGLRGAGRLRPAAEVPARPRSRGTPVDRVRGVPAVRLLQHPLHDPDVDRRRARRQDDPLRAAAARPAAGGVGLRLRRPAPQAVLAVAARGELAARLPRLPRRGRPRGGPYAGRGHGDQVAARRGGRRGRPARHRHRRAAVPVRAAAPGHHRGRGRAERRCSTRGCSSRRTRSCCSTRPRRWWTESTRTSPSSCARGAARTRSWPSPTSGFTSWAGLDQVEAVNSISGERRNLHPHELHRLRHPAPATRRSSTSSTRSTATAPATTAPSASAGRPRPSRTPTPVPASGMDAALDAIKPGVSSDTVALTPRA